MTTHRIRFSLVLHNHQPIGNFDHVFEQAYQDSYLPFLDVFEPYETLRIALHTSGPLMEWLDQRHPEYLDRLTRLVAADRVEIVGGAFYEPILAMIPSRDRQGQIQAYTRWLEARLSAKVQGLWVPERVWEQSMTRDLAAAGVKYTVLDDYHFKNAGLTEQQLYGYYVTEDDGQMLSVFPGSERLRYLIPFQDPEETIHYLGQVANEHPGAVVLFGDDGEKFGTWPETHQHVYHNGWLRRFFDLLVENSSWIEMTTPSDALRAAQPLGKIYLPEGSYREMTEWALPAERQVEFEHVRHDLQDAGSWDRIAQFVHGGFWRNFKVRYPESDEMYARMMMVSTRLREANKAALGDDMADEFLTRARTDLYRGQCNCSYWHGAFGGIYLPHLRNAVYQHLIAADNLLDRAAGRGNSTWAEAATEDYNFDGQKEAMLSNDKLLALFEPSAGGRLYELDVRSICHNLLATLARRPEAYHEKVRRGPSHDGDDVASIHDRVVFKQEGLDGMLIYDQHPRKSLQDHFFADDTSLASIVEGGATQVGDFLGAPYEYNLESSRDRVAVTLWRTGQAAGHALTIKKRVVMTPGSGALAISYEIEGLPSDEALHFAVEMNFAGMPAGADDRFFYDKRHNRLGQLGEQLDLHDAEGIGLIDQWLGIDVGLSCSRPTNIWTYPIASVSQSEGGFEAVHQSVCVMPHWLVQGDENGHWSAALTLSIDTSLAERKHSQAPLAGVV